MMSLPIRLSGPMFLPSGGSLSRGSLFRGSLFRGWSLSRGVSVARSPNHKSRRCASYWNAFLFFVSSGVGYMVTNVTPPT